MKFQMKVIIAGLLIVPFFGAAHSQTVSDIGTYLREHSQLPVNYVISKATSHRITLIGEAHWLQQDVSLVTALIPLLHKAEIDLAAEIFPASEQHRIDELIRAPKWNDQVANAVMRAASWPYQEYRDLLRVAWAANQTATRPTKIVALGPPEDWRDSLLPRGITYDAFMADLVSKHIGQTRRPVVVYCGMHHAFTRYYQAELDNAGRASGYMDRMGNLLSRRFGEQVFLIALNKPIWCGNPARPSYCLAFGGRIDCEATKIGRPIGVDVVGSPLGEMRFALADYYSYGHPALRFVDYTDGYVWSGPIESFRPVTIIPLNEYAPDEAALKQVTHRNPFNDEVDVSITRLQEIWVQQTESSRDILTSRKWKHLANWQSRCQ